MHTYRVGIADASEGARMKVILSSDHLLIENEGIMLAGKGEKTRETLQALLSLQQVYWSHYCT